MLFTEQVKYKSLKFGLHVTLKNSIMSEKSKGISVKVRRNFYDKEHPAGFDPDNPKPSKRFRFEIITGLSKERAEELVGIGFVGYCDDKGRFVKEPKAKAFELKPLPDNPKSTTIEEILSYAGHKRIALTDQERRLTKKELLALVKSKEAALKQTQGVESAPVKLSEGVKD